MSTMNTDKARFNMIEQQIRPWEVLDQRVLDTFAAILREEFVPQRYRNLAFADVRIPLGHEQAMLNPNIEGRLLQALEITPADSILEIGTGSGFVTACLAALGRHVTSVEIIGEFTNSARTRLRGQQITNVTLETGDGARSWGKKTYDAIALGGSLPALTDSWRQQLAIGGRLFAVVGQAPIMEALLVIRTSEHQWLTESLFETELEPLTNCAQPSSFRF